MSDLTKEELVKLAEIAGYSVIDKHLGTHGPWYIKDDVTKSGEKVKRFLCVENWNPAERIAQAMEVLHKFCDGIINAYKILQWGESKKITIKHAEDLKSIHFDYIDSKLSLAICKAVLKASEAE